MVKKLTDEELSLIMSYADDQLNDSELEIVKKLISENIEAKLAYEDFKLSKNFYGDYVSSIKDNSSKIFLRNKDNLENRKRSFFEVIFKNPVRNFVTYPIAAIFMFTIGFQMNSTSFRGLDNDTDNFRGVESITTEKVDERIKSLEEEISYLKNQIEKYLEEIKDLKKRLEKK